MRTSLLLLEEHFYMNLHCLRFSETSYIVLHDLKFKVPFIVKLGALKFDFLCVFLVEVVDLRGNGPPDVKATQG